MIALLEPPEGCECDDCGSTDDVLVLGWQHGEALDLLLTLCGKCRIRLEALLRSVRKSPDTPRISNW